MGIAIINVTFLGHGQPGAGTETGGVRFHLGNAGVDEAHVMPNATWTAIKGFAKAGNRGAFETALQAAVTPSTGWTQDVKDAAWRAGVWTFA